MDVLDRLKSALGEAQIVQDAAALRGYSRDWTGHFESSPMCVVTPRSTDEMATALRLLSEAGLHIIMQGGNTGLVGGSVGGAAPHVIVSTRQLRSELRIDHDARRLTASAGYTLAEVQQFARANGFEYRVDLASRDSATIAGTVATNAGGIRVVAHGMTRNQVLGLEVVLSDGSIIENLEPLLKDNSGSDLGQLFIGSEGTLGAITAVTVQLHEPRIARWTALIPVLSIEDAVNFCTPIQGQILAAEVFQAAGANLVAQDFNVPVLDESTPWWLLAEGDGELPTSEELPEESFVAQSASDVERMWLYRELQAEVVNRQSNVVKIDVSVPRDQLDDFLYEVQTMAPTFSDGEVQCFFFGHVMDGNIHIAITHVSTYQECMDAVVALAVDYGGTISAEHGVGRTKSHLLPLVKSPTELRIMSAIRAACDPAGVMNPDVLRVESR